jgi:outer membrane protein OmpA-like peptidoglycan-associated protein
MIATVLPTVADGQIRVGPPTLHQSIGLYLGIGGAWNNLTKQTLKATGLSSREVRSDDGWLAAAQVGYDMGWLRFELEGGFRQNDTDTVSLGSTRQRLKGDIGGWYAMANAIVDIDTGTPLTPYVGVGAGAMGLNHDYSSPSFRVDDGKTVFAYQAIAGLAWNFSPSVSAHVDYRWFRTLDGSFRDQVSGASYKSNYESHAVMAGLTWRFGAPPPRPSAVAPPSFAAPPPPPPRPAATPSPAAPPSGPREFVVFFDFDRASLTEQGLAVVRGAAAAALAGQATRIRVIGHADRSGTDSYNENLSRRRAETVRGELVRQGVTPGVIATNWAGERQPRVPTPDGVREPQNRRVEIVFGS